MTQTAISRCPVLRGSLWRTYRFKPLSLSGVCRAHAHPVPASVFFSWSGHLPPPTCRFGQLLVLRSSVMRWELRCKWFCEDFFFCCCCSHSLCPLPKRLILIFYGTYLQIFLVTEHAYFPSFSCFVAWKIVSSEILEPYSQQLELFLTASLQSLRVTACISSFPSQRVPTGDPPRTLKATLLIVWRA